MKKLMCFIVEEKVNEINQAIDLWPRNPKEDGFKSLFYPVAPHLGMLQNDWDQLEILSFLRSYLKPGHIEMAIVTKDTISLFEAQMLELLVKNGATVYFESRVVNLQMYAIPEFIEIGNIELIHPGESQHVHFLTLYGEHANIKGAKYAASSLEDKVLNENQCYDPESYLDYINEKNNSNETSKSEAEASVRNGV